MISLLSAVLFAFMPFYSLQCSALLSNEEVVGLIGSKNKVYANKIDKPFQLKTFFLTLQPELKLTAISKSSEHIVDFVHSKTYEKQVSLNGPLEHFVQKKLFFSIGTG